MKTAMQELLENLQKQFDEQINPIRIDGTYFLEKEKEQIIEANRQGRCNDCPIMYTTLEAQEYYNQTYN